MELTLKIVLLTTLMIINSSYTQLTNTTSNSIQRQYTFCAEGPHNDLNCNLIPDARCQNLCEKAKKDEKEGRKLIKVGLTKSSFCRCTESSGIKDIEYLSTKSSSKFLDNLIYSFCIEDAKKATYCTLYTDTLCKDLCEEGEKKYGENWVLQSIDDTTGNFCKCPHTNPTPKTNTICDGKQENYTYCSVNPDQNCVDLCGKYKDTDPNKELIRVGISSSVFCRC